ncbi:SWIM zinc finger domain-containing protein [Rhizobium puerariae]|uniref:SWIM zinc finger domain-containing protein n=1 Tax=Rhizobium puerariae TaxID=1585791 RepID=A0ABV6AP32_9HYPH
MKLEHHHITSLFEQRYIDRGRAYFEEGMVEIVTSGPGNVTSRCAGTQLYKVELGLIGGQLTGNCNCPAFADFGPCKHMAATAFAAIAHAKESYRPSARYVTRREEFELLERRLRRMTKSELIGIILQHLGDDEEMVWSILGVDQE